MKQELANKLLDDFTTVVPYVVKWHLEENKPLYVIYVGNLKITRDNASKYIFEVIGFHNENTSKIRLNRIGNDNYAEIWTREIANNFVNVSEIITELSNQEIKDIIVPDHLLKYANLIKQEKLLDVKINEYDKEAHAMPPSDYYSNSKIENKGKQMKNDKMNALIESNSDAAKVAAKVAAGQSINKVVMEKVKGQLPMMMRGYSDHPLASVVLANVVNFAVDNFAENNTKARWVSDAMLVAAMTEFMNSFNLEQLLTEVLNTASISIPEELDI